MLQKYTFLNQFIMILQIFVYRGVLPHSGSNLTQPDTNATANCETTDLLAKSNDAKAEQNESKIICGKACSQLKKYGEQGA